MNITISFYNYISNDFDHNELYLGFGDLSFQWWILIGVLHTYVSNQGRNPCEDLGATAPMVGRICPLPLVDICRVKVFGNLGWTSVVPVAPVATSLSKKYKLDLAVQGWMTDPSTDWPTLIKLSKGVVTCCPCMYCTPCHFYANNLITS